MAEMRGLANITIVDDSSGTMQPEVFDVMMGSRICLGRRYCPRTQISSEQAHLLRPALPAGVSAKLLQGQRPGEVHDVCRR